MRRDPGTLGAAWRFIKDPSASPGTKLLFVAAIFYVVFPFDAVPDLIPIVGWLDDLGLSAIATAFLWRAIARYKKESVRELGQSLEVRRVVETEGVDVR